LSLITVKLIIISLFIFFTSPTATHAVANAARTMGLRPALVPDSDIQPPRTDGEGKG
jgi:multicomponent Na+:H+ antiporter subunit G